MKKITTIFAALCAIVLGSCTSGIEEDFTPTKTVLPDLTAGFADDNQTKTYVENGKYLRWHAADEIAVFFGNTLNSQYMFAGETGDNSGTFSPILSNELGTGNSLDAIYAVYPYDKTARITDQGVISLTLPATQSYAENSFGKGANTMIAVTKSTKDTFLPFKNACGYLTLKLYNANGAKLRSVEIKGNAGEKIAGAATATIEYGGAPALVMGEAATTSVTLDCGEQGIELGASADAATELWIALPATTFASGITITATDTKGITFEKSTSKTVDITRNDIQPMAALEAKFEEEEEPAGIPANNEIWYTATNKLSYISYIGATIKSHAFDNATGRGVITFTNDLTTISANAFSNAYDLTGITLPESITSIGDYAFDVCYWLTNITIPNSVTKIGRGAFSNCYRLENITLPNNLTSIEDQTFFNCEALTSIIIPESVTSIAINAFYNCYALASFESKYESEDKRCLVIDGALCAFAPAELTSYTLTNDITSIATCFCSEILESITIPESVTSIERTAFYNCQKLTTVYCNAATPPTLLDTYTFPESVTTIYVPEKSVEAYKNAWSAYADKIATPTPDDNEIWYTNGSTTTATEPHKTNVFGANIVSNKYDTSKKRWVITFDGNISSIGDYAFLNKNDLTSITIPEGVTSIGENAFSYCRQMASIILPSTITSISDYAFSICNSLTSITIPEGVTSIGMQAFYATGLTSVTIPSSVASIGDDAFYYCTDLVSIVVAEGNTKYDSREGCNAIIETESNCLVVGCNASTIPNGVTSIGDKAFASCEKLTEITIPNSVTSIGDYAFSYCSNLQEVYCYAVNPPALGYSVFNGSKYVIYFNVPATSVDAYKQKWSGGYECKIYPIE